MFSPTNQRSEPKFLSSWKEIANYMGRGVRTVQRYEVQFGLPVRRPAGKSRGSVVATRAEIDAWVAASSIRETLQLPSQKLQNNPDLLAIRKGIDEMKILRQQMNELRAQTGVSLQLLIDGLRELRSASTDQRRRSDDSLDDAIRASGVHFGRRLLDREM